MSTSDQEQKSVNVKQHHRLAMGEKLNGQTQQSKTSKPAGGLAGVVAKKNK